MTDSNTLISSRIISIISEYSPLTQANRYVHNGYSKFGAITIEKDPNSDKSSLSYQLFVDGVPTWNTTILSPERSSDAKTAGGLWERLTGAR